MTWYDGLNMRFYCCLIFFSSICKGSDPRRGRDPWKGPALCPAKNKSWVMCTSTCYLTSDWEIACRAPTATQKLPTPTWAYKTGQAKLVRALNPGAYPYNGRGKIGVHSAIGAYTGSSRGTCYTQRENLGKPIGNTLRETAGIKVQER